MPTTTHHITHLPLQNGPWLFLILAALTVLCALCFWGYNRSRSVLPPLMKFPSMGPGYCERHFLEIIGSHTAETKLYDQDAVDV